MREKNTYIGNFIGSLFGFGIPMGAVYGILLRDVKKGILSGVLAGLLFAGCMILFSVIISAKMKNVRENLKKEHQILYEGAANHLYINEAAGGWMFLLENEIYFVSHKVNMNVHTCTIPYADIVSVCKSKTINTIQIELRDGKKERFVVNHRNKWIHYLEKKIR